MFKFKKRLRHLGILLGIAFLFFIQPTQAQEISLKECYQLARINFPLVKQLDLIEKTKEFNLANIANGFLPKLSIQGQATYQSEVTQIPIELPGMNIPTISKDQYKLYGEAYLPLTERVNLKSQQKISELSAAVEKQKVEVDLYQLKERIHQLYFSILLLEEQIVQNNLLKKDLETAIEKTNAAVANGTASAFNVDLLIAEMFKVDQKIIELSANRSAFITILSALIGQDLMDKVKLVKPINIATFSPQMNRPEIALFDLQNAAIGAQTALINNRKIPRLGLFAQGGIGRPTLNFLSNDFEPYFIGGIKLNWNLSSLFNNKNDSAILQLNRSKVATQKETFLLNTKINSQRHSGDLAKYQALIESDKALIEVRERIKNTANIQLENGLISALDYANYLNAAHQVKQNLSIHEMMLLKAQYEYQTVLGQLEVN